MKKKCKGCATKTNNYHKHPLMCDSCADIYVVHHNEIDSEMRSLYEQEFNIKFSIPGSGIRGYTHGEWINHDIDTIKFWKNIHTHMTILHEQMILQDHSH